MIQNGEEEVKEEGDEAQENGVDKKVVLEGLLTAAKEKAMEYERR